jgi:hypothetical protein
MDGDSNKFQGAFFVLSLLYIYLLSDLFVIINNGVSMNLVMKICIPIWGKIFVVLFNLLSEYSEDFKDWWMRSVSVNIIISYIFKALKLLHKSNLHMKWEDFLKKGIDYYFIFILSKIFYNYIFNFGFSLYYLIFSCLCAYSIYIKFRTSNTAFITLSGKFIEMGSSMVISDNLYRLEDYKDYCIKNKDSWLSYTIKLIIGYHYEIDIDGELMAKESADFFGTIPKDCNDMYKSSLIRKVTSVVETTRNVYNKITTSFYGADKLEDDFVINKNNANEETTENTNEKTTENTNEKTIENIDVAEINLRQFRKNP